MSLTTTQTSIQYTGTGSITQFTFPYRFFNSTDLVVTVTVSGTDTILNYGVDYTVTGAGATNGGYITCTTAPANGSTVTIQRIVPFTQTMALTTVGDSDPTVLNTNADEIVAMCQQQQTQIARSIQFPASEPSTSNPILSSAVTRANKVWGFDAAGSPTLYNPFQGTVIVNSGAIIDVSNMATLAATPVTSLTTGQLLKLDGYYTTNDGGQGWFKLDKSGGTADGGTVVLAADGTSVWRRERNAGEYNVKWFGAKGDNLNDDTSATQSMFTSIGTSAATAYFPSGTYLINSTVSITTSSTGLNILGFNATLKAKAENSTALLAATSANYLTVQGITFDGKYASASLSITTGLLKLTACTNTQVFRCNFNNSAICGVALFGACAGVEIVRCNANNIYDAIFANWDGTYWAKDLLITGNIITGCIGSYTSLSGGIKLSGNGGTANQRDGRNIVVTGNIIDGTFEMGIEVWGNLNGSVITGNAIKNTSYGVSVANYSYNCTVSGNGIKAAASYGVELGKAKACTISNNVIDMTTDAGAATGSGIIFDDTTSTYHTVSGNTIIGGYGGCIYSAYVGSNITIAGNTLLGTSGNQVIDIAGAASSSFNFSNNVIVGVSASGGITLDTSSGNISNITLANNQWGGSFLKGVNFNIVGANTITYFKAIGNDFSGATFSSGLWYGAYSQYVTNTNFKGNIYGTTLTFTITATISLTSFTDTIYFCDATSGAITITHPTAANYPECEQIFIKSDSGGNAITVPSASGNISLSSKGSSVTVKSIGGAWWAINKV